MTRSMSKHVLAAAAVLALGAGAVAVAQPAPSNAPAASTAPAATQTQAHRSHVEGRIAYLKTELKITDQQAAAFNKVADVMRANDRERAAMREQMHQAREARQTNAPRPNAIERMEARQKFMAAASARDARTLEAWKPLYAQLSDEQKQAADELLGGRHGDFGHRHHRA